MMKLLIWRWTSGRLTTPSVFGMIMFGGPSKMASKMAPGASFAGVASQASKFMARKQFKWA